MRVYLYIGFAALAFVACARTYIVPETIIDERITRRQLRHNEKLSLSAL
jgi:hypothetical protein